MRRIRRRWTSCWSANIWDLPDRLREIYEGKRERLGLVRPGVRFITDRAFSNFWHIGLIKLLYPEAPIIHVLRHPYDLMLANMAHDRKFEGNAQAGLPAHGALLWACMPI